MKEIRNQVFPEERALYSETNIIIDHCEFKGSIEGESALKESSNIISLSSCDAHRSIPNDSTPRIFTGFKFSTTTTFLPTSSSGL